MSSAPTSAALTVLLVEDSDDDAFFFQRATRQKASLRVIRARDGEEAKHYLSGTGPYSDRAQHPLPDAVLTDLKMPLCTGTELVSWMRSQPDHAQTPCVIVSSSNVQSDMEAARVAGATAYLVKPSTLAGYEHLWDAFRKVCAHVSAFSVTLPQER